MSGEHGLFFGGGIMWLIWVVIIIGFIYIVKSIVSGGSSGSGNANTQSPKDILDKRLASGEIDQEEYTRLRNEIEK